MLTAEERAASVHVFENAGLGKAPFRLIDVVERRGPYPVGEPHNGVQGYVGAPGQPVGCCSFCKTGIAQCCVIRSADGKVFDVGNECVKRTGDLGLIKASKPIMAKLARDARHKNEAESIAWAVNELQRDEVIAKLAALPHPTEWRAKNGESKLQWATWFMQTRGVGNAGKMKVVRAIRALSKEAS